MNIFINSYYPIIQTSFGREAAKKFIIHPLENGSIRREPDFTHPLPAISGLCRPGSMKDIDLKVDDIMIYKTNGTHFLAAILRVIKMFHDHKMAAKWLKKHNYSIPSNNIKMDPLPLEMSHVMNFIGRVGRSKKLDRQIHENWNSNYIKRGQSPRSSYFYLTKPIYNAIQANIKESEFIRIGEILRNHNQIIPNTALRPKMVSLECYSDILQSCNTNFASL